MLKLITKTGLVLIALILVVALIVQIKFINARDEQISFDPGAISIPTDQASINEGLRLAQLKGCFDCHGTDLSGKIFADAGPVGRFVGSNISPVGVTANYQDIDWARAIRYGLNPQGRKLIFMPSTEFTQLTNMDLAKIIAYLKSAPPATTEHPELTVGPLAKILYVLGKFPMMFQSELIDRKVTPVENIMMDESIAYGKYLAAGCTGCHGNDMKGGPIAGVPPDWPAAADLTKTGNVQKWSKEEFALTLRTGTKPDGQKIDPMYMPWTSFAAMNETEMTAIYNYIKSL